jgi:RNA polymerase sigma factor (sigma-70 family)
MPIVSAAEDELIPTRRSLLSRLKDWDDQESWRDFFNTYWRLIYGVALKAGLTEPEAQDVVQETVLSVAKKMRDFKYDPVAGSFKGWLLQLTRWRITDQLRRRPPASVHSFAGRTDEARTPTVDRIVDPNSLEWDAVWNDEWEKNLLAAALARIRRQVSPKQYQIFDLYVLKQWPVAKVKESLAVSRTQIYLAKHRVGGLVKKEARRLEAQFNGEEGK